MILQRLYEYYQRLTGESEGIAPEGFEKKEIPFLIILNEKGEFLDFQDTRQGEGKKKTGRTFTVPRAIKRSSGIAANLLWDNPAYILGMPKPDKNKDHEELTKRAKEQQEAFIARIHESFPDTQDKGILAILTYLEKHDYSLIFKHRDWKEIEETGANITFKLSHDNGLICQRQEVMLKLNASKNDNASEQQQCLVTGEKDRPVLLHAAIKGVRGAQSSGANIVSFNLDSFNSFGKKQGYNAPIGEKAEFAYTTALNTLLAKNSHQHIQIGDATTVFWAAKKNKLEDIFGDFFGSTEKDENIPDTESIKALFNSPNTGIPPLTEDLTPFFVLGLSPNASRIAIRFWYAGTVSEVSRNMVQHYNDLEIVKSQHEWKNLKLQNLLRSTAIQEKYDNIPPNLAGEVMKSVLTNTPYPRTLLNAAIIRIKAEQSKKDKSSSKSLPNVTYQRAALIKAVLCREARYYKLHEKEVDVSLDINNVNPGYRLGRLFAALERAQELASPNLNATIRDRFYSAASSTPVAAFPNLLRLKNYHIAKLENKGTSINLEKLIGEIMDGLGDFPSHLNLTDQGRFAIGYYHQRQAFFPQNNSSQNKTESEK